IAIRIVTQGTARRVASEKLRDRDTARSTKIRIALPRSGLVQPAYGNTTRTVKQNEIEASSFRRIETALSQLRCLLISTILLINRVFTTE
ncbi:MAG: hypothetical protein M0Z89_03100, partial [Nitrospiraceae bacterium]|nr:hypothetical protein [Nitrospiraceae bacterium]